MCKRFLMIFSTGVCDYRGGAAHGRKTNRRMQACLNEGVHFRLGQRIPRLILGLLVGDNGRARTLDCMEGSTAPQAKETTRSILNS
jgi:hypothetical protein